MSDRSHGSLPSNIEKNPRKEIKAITLRSGKELEKVKNKGIEELSKETI